jgi:hypothetical protein
MAGKTSQPREPARKPAGAPAPAPKPADRETAAAIKRFEKRYGETLDRLAKR